MEAVKTDKEPQGAQAQCSRFSVNGELSTQSDAFINWNKNNFNFLFIVLYKF